MGKKEKTRRAEKIKEKLSLLERSTARETEQRLKQEDACYTGITRDAGADSFIPTVCFADL